jgi:hypothetical protein
MVSSSVFTTLVGAFALVAGVRASTMELREGTFDDAVKDSGKNAFVKFLAPW